MKRTLLISMLATLVACTSSPNAVRNNSTAQQVLGARLQPEFQTEVMIFGTPHLNGYADRIRPEHLSSTLDLLEHEFKPTRIAVEQLPADELALLIERARHEPAAAQLLDMFGNRTIRLGEYASKQTGLNRIQARLGAAELLTQAEALDVDARVRLVYHLLAAYEYPSALLQWSYLPDEARNDGARWPAEIREALNKGVASPNEVSSIAVRLAHRLGLQRIESVDSQYDSARTLAMPRAALEDLFRNPARGEWKLAEMTSATDSVREQAFANGDLLPYFQRVNSRSFAEHDMRQWLWLLEAQHPSGLDRFRYAMWDLRNQRIASNIVDVAASTRPENLLVIIGSAHKAPLDDALFHLVSIRLRQFNHLANE